MRSTFKVISFILLFGVGRAFVIHNPVAKLKHSSSVVYAGMASPEVETKTKVKQETKTRQKVYHKETVRTGDPVSRRDEEFEDPPMFTLMLLGDDGYDKEHVILRMCSVLEDLDEDRAMEVFQQAQASGKAMAGIYPFEKAELYKEQLLRSTPMIFADMVEDKN
ncbi:hypothetical protein MPSEU_000723300 [Mayamaea pseudoterrestris]|nr:hypothetical protein MPSEU_000723300 [Mayamaea pseudoterrestris]